METLRPVLDVRSGVGWTFPDGKHRLEAVLGPSRAGSVSPAGDAVHSIVTVDVWDWSTGNDQAFGVMARLSNVGPGTTDGYAMTYSVGS